MYATPTPSSSSNDKFEEHWAETFAFVRMALAIATDTHKDLLLLPEKVL